MGTRKTDGADKRYLTASQLCERWGGRSEMFLHRMLKTPDFPKPIYVGRYRLWALDAIEAYERSALASTAPRRRSHRQQQGEAAR